MSRESLHGGSERPLSETVKAKPRLHCWRCQSHGCLPKRALHGDWNQPESSGILQATKDGREEPPKPLRHRRSRGFGVFTEGL